MANLMTKQQQRIADSIATVKTGKQSAKYYNLAVADSTAGLESLAEKGIEAQILTNFQRIMDSDLGQQLTTSANFGPYVMELWPVVTAWYPDFPLKDLISVQSMDKPLAYLAFSKLLAGTNKAPTVVGEEVETPLGKRKIRGSYPTGEIMGEEIPATQMENDGTNTLALLHYCPLNLHADYPQKIRIEITGGANAGTYVYFSASGNTITLAKSTTPTVASNITIDIQSGAITIPETTKQVTKIKANYVWNLDYADDMKIPTVTEDITLEIMEAIPRAIGMKWTMFSEYLKTQFGTDIREENTKRILNLLYQYQVRYVLDTMYDYATGNNSTPVVLNIPGATTMSVEVKSQEVQKELKKIATDIEYASGRVEGNRIVCGKNFKTFVESLPSTLFQRKATPQGFSGPREIGTYGTFKVYFDPFRDDEDALMTYRGDEWYDSTMYLGVFMPITPTDAVALGVQVREAFCSMEAYKLHKPSCIYKIKVKFV